MNMGDCSDERFRGKFHDGDADGTTEAACLQMGQPIFNTDGTSANLNAIRCAWSGVTRVVPTTAALNMAGVQCSRRTTTATCCGGTVALWCDTEAGGAPRCDIPTYRTSTLTAQHPSC
jgi:hypothetical protein